MKYKRFVCQNLLLVMAVVSARDVMAQELPAPTQQQAANPGQLDGPVYELRRIKAEAPIYPRKAKSDKLEGWVDLLLTVDTRGHVAKAEVVDAEPRRVFERAALRAAYKWRFAPPGDDGISDDQQALVRITFKVDA